MMLHSTKEALLSLSAGPERDAIQAKSGERQEFLSLFQREEMDIAIPPSGSASQIRSQCPGSWRQRVRKDNSSQREISAPWEPMPKALIVFDETL